MSHVDLHDADGTLVRTVFIAKGADPDIINWRGRLFVWRQGCEYLEGNPEDLLPAAYQAEAQVYIVPLEPWEK